MIESPLLQKMVADSLHRVLQVALRARFGSVPRDVTRLLRNILDDRKLIKLAGVAGKCPDLDKFREALRRQQPKPRRGKKVRDITP
jgi:hypothetical protein